jgi:hypothetical protein
VAGSPLAAVMVERESLELWREGDVEPDEGATVILVGDDCTRR